MLESWGCGLYTSAAYTRVFTVPSGEGLLFETDVLTTCVVVIFRVKSHLTLKIASAYVVKTSIANNSPSQDSNHSDDLFQSRYVTPGFKPFYCYDYCPNL